MVGAAADPTERQADAMADHVMSLLAAGPSRIAPTGDIAPASQPPERAASRIARASRPVTAEVGMEGGAAPDDVSAEIGKAMDCEVKKTLQDGKAFQKVLDHARKTKPWLLVVGLDVIGDYLTEVNVTSPTCFVEISEQSGFDVGGMFADALVRARLRRLVPFL